MGKEKMAYAGNGFLMALAKMQKCPYKRLMALYNLGVRGNNLR